MQKKFNFSHHHRHPIMQLRSINWIKSEWQINMTLSLLTNFFIDSTSQAPFSVVCDNKQHDASLELLLEFYWKIRTACMQCISVLDEILFDKKMFMCDSDIHWKLELRRLMHAELHYGKEFSSLNAKCYCRQMLLTTLLREVHTDIEMTFYTLLIDLIRLEFFLMQDLID